MKIIAKMAIAALAVGWVAAAQAAPIVGSFAFADGANETGASLLGRTNFSVTNATTQPGATGNFSSVVAGLSVTIGTFDIPDAVVSTTLVSPSNFRASFTGGSFVASAGRKIDQIVSTATGNESITIQFLGVFTPADGLSGFQPNDASVIANLNRSGNNTGGFSVSSAFTLSAPPANGTPVEVQVPEPASMALLGAGLAGLGLVRRRKA